MKGQYLYDINNILNSDRDNSTKGFLLFQKYLELPAKWQNDFIADMKMAGAANLAEVFESITKELEKGKSKNK